MQRALSGAGRVPGAPKEAPGSGFRGDNVRMLTPDVFRGIRKTRKILPATAMKRNSAHQLWQLTKTYRYFCSATSRWIIADEVAYDEKSGTFQSVKAYQKAVRPRNGVKTNFNFWPQLGIGQQKYKALTVAPDSPFMNPAAAFIPSSKQMIGVAATPETAAHSTAMPPPQVIQNQYTGAESIGMGDFASTILADGTSMGAESTVYDHNSMFDATEATSIAQGTEKGSVMDASDIKEREAEGN
eukprot:TRINITY_DN3976_c10_g1_i1.p1 TRINITY_DN3976_c10_g1~~TRINITY_DN3976_c10_g1_i1.p1  ORF type:complete len:242 (+),score=48.69 TRINITY_DN3976_c10_g1_i1:47-772(+)